MTTTIPSLTTTTLIENTLKRRISYILMFISSSQEVLGVNSVGSFMHGNIIGHFQAQFVAKKPAGLGFTSSL